MSSARLLEFVTRLTYTLDGLSGKLRLYFSQFLTFHFSKTLSINQIENIENKQASLLLKSDEAIREAAVPLTDVEKCWAVGAIQHLQAEAERIDDRVVSRALGKLAEQLITVLSLQGKTDMIEVERRKIEDEYQGFVERPVVRIPAQIWPLSLDFFLRCSFLIYCSELDFGEGSFSGIIATTNIIVFPLITLLIVVVYRRWHKRENRKLLEAYGGAERFQIEYHVSATQYTWLAIFLGLGTFISNLLMDETWRAGVPLPPLAFFGLAVCYFLYLRLFILGRISENDLVRQLDKSTLHTDKMSVDENDEMIVKLETKLHSSTSRLDAYVLESALFGALSFSCFLQIMASNLVSFADLENFASGIFSTSKSLIHLQWEGFWSGLGLLTNKVNLFCLVSVESLVCSIFFLAVIASRLRFSDIADKVRTAINLARAFNEKEEALYHEREHNDVRQSRLNELTLRVNRQLFQANQALMRVGPVVAYMEYFRNAGILVFLIILISSSLFITSVLGWIFLGLVAATSIYFNRGRINIIAKASMLSLRVAFLRQSHWFVLIAISPFFLAMSLRNSFGWIYTGEIMALGYLLVGSFISAWLLLASHYDAEFGDIEKKESMQRISRWNRIKGLLAFGVFLYCTGMAAKQVHMAGADEMTVLGAGIIAVLMYFAGYYLSKVKWFGIISGAMLGSASVGLLFKTLHLEGADELVLIGMIAMICMIVWSQVVWRKRAVLHSSFLRFCLVMLFVTSTFVTGFFLRAELAYAHRTFRLGPIMGLYEVHNGSYYATKIEIDNALAAAEKYISVHGTNVPFTAVYRDLSWNYDNFGETVLWQIAKGEQVEPAITENAIRAVRERNKILGMYAFHRDAVFGFDLGLEADLLTVLGKREEAKASLIALREILSSDEQRQLLDEKLASFDATPTGGVSVP
jgi:hypothetical protein